jgi:hypothetical protein
MKKLALSLWLISSLSQAALFTTNLLDKVYAIETSGVTWNMAATAAASLEVDGVDSFYLAVIGDATENAFIETWLQSLSISTTAPDGGGATYAWIGLRQADGHAEPSGSWTWSEDESSTYLNWGVGSFGSEPDDYSGPENGFEGQDHAAIGLSGWPLQAPGAFGNSGEWNDLYGDNTMAYVMEANVPEPLIASYICGSVFVLMAFKRLKLI